jgi:hypothetical protein
MTTMMKRRNTADEDKEDLPQEEEQVIFYVYGHAKHNHPIASEGKYKYTTYWFAFF